MASCATFGQLERRVYFSNEKREYFKCSSNPDLVNSPSEIGKFDPWLFQIFFVLSTPDAFRMQLNVSLVLHNLNTIESVGGSMFIPCCEYQGEREQFS